MKKKTKRSMLFPCLCNNWQAFILAPFLIYLVTDRYSFWNVSPFSLVRDYVFLSFGHWFVYQRVFIHFVNSLFVQSFLIPPECPLLVRWHRLICFFKLFLSHDVYTKLNYWKIVDTLIVFRSLNCWIIRKAAVCSGP